MQRILQLPKLTIRTILDQSQLSQVQFFSSIRKLSSAMSAKNSAGVAKSSNTQSIFALRPSTCSKPLHAISPDQDDVHIRSQYRPFLLKSKIAETDWVARLELDRASEMVYQDLQKTGQRLRILVLYGSLRQR